MKLKYRIKIFIFLVVSTSSVLLLNNNCDVFKVISTGNPGSVAKPPTGTTRLSSLDCRIDFSCEKNGACAHLAIASNSKNKEARAYSENKVTLSETQSIQLSAYGDQCSQLAKSSLNILNRKKLFQLPEPAIDMNFLDVNDDGVQELLVLSLNKISVYSGDWSGTLPLRAEMVLPATQGRLSEIFTIPGSSNWLLYSPQTLETAFYRYVGGQLELIKVSQPLNTAQSQFIDAEVYFKNSLYFLVLDASTNTIRSFSLNPENGLGNASYTDVVLEDARPERIATGNFDEGSDILAMAAGISKPVSSFAIIRTFLGRMVTESLEIASTSVAKDFLLTSVFRDTKDSLVAYFNNSAGAESIVRSLEVGDLNGDGSRDISVLVGAPAQTYLVLSSARTFDQIAPIATRHEPKKNLIYDLDADQKNNLVSLSKDGRWLEIFW